MIRLAKECAWGEGKFLAFLLEGAALSVLQQGSGLREAILFATLINELAAEDKTSTADELHFRLSVSNELGDRRKVVTKAHRELTHRYGGSYQWLHEDVKKL